MANTAYQTYGNTHPQIDILFCSGCGECISSCPNGALGMRLLKEWGFPYLIFPEKCTGCGECARTCKKQVIELTGF